MTTRLQKIVPVSVKLPTADRDRLTTLAPARKRTSHHLMREAVSAHLGREGARQSFREEAARAWRDYKETGLHLSQEDVDAWIDALGTPEPKRRPKWRK